MAVKTTFQCGACSKSFEDFVSNKRSGFCSLPCYWQSKRGGKGYWYGKKRSLKDRHKISQGRKGLSVGEKHFGWKGGKKKCVVCAVGLTSYLSQRCQKCYLTHRLGKNHPNWVKDRNSLVRSEKKHLDGRYREWMRAVKGRDGWKCQMSDTFCKGRLEAHHIDSWREKPELRYEIKNGITLCHAHHPRGGAEEKRLAPQLKALVAVSKEILWR